MNNPKREPKPKDGQHSNASSLDVTLLQIASLLNAQQHLALAQRYEELALAHRRCAQLKAPERDFKPITWN
jgi:hypothetical protein